MLTLDMTLPDAVILPEQVTDLRAYLADAGAHWFAMVPPFVEMDAGATKRVAALASCTSDAMAARSGPHEKVAFDNYDAAARGLRFVAGHHCGYVLSDVAADPACWSCAVRFRAGEDSPQTLFTLNPEGAENYVFLQQVQDRVILKDQQNTLEVSAPVVPGEIALVIAGYSDNRLWLHTGVTTCSAAADAPLDLAGLHHLFIGCRSQKPGLKKTLGAFLLRDLVFWPERNVLTPDDRTALEALAQPQLWEL